MTRSGTVHCSVILPVRNEERHLARCLDSIATQDFPRDGMEVLVVDGHSADRTRDIARSYQDRLPRLRVLDNPHRTVPYAMNIGIRAAAGRWIVRVDGHCVLAADYVRRCIETLESTGADCAGGPMRCDGERYWGRAIAVAMSSRFGVGNVLFRREDYRGPVDTVYLGAWPREVFTRVAMFDEELTNNQDDELAYRIRKAGGTVWLEPGIRSLYYARESIPRLWRQYYRYGLYKVRVLQKHPLLMQPRHFVPPAFVAAWAVGAAAAPFWPLAAWGLAALAGAYGTVALLASLSLARSTRMRYLTAFPLLFAVLHFSYGSGFLVGLVRFSTRWLRPEPEPPRLPEPALEPAAATLPRLSVLIPMRDERRHLEEFLDSLYRQDYPIDRVEYLLVDGGSTDGSRELAEHWATRFPAGAFRVLDNPERTVPHGLNRALQAAKGEVVARMDVHSVYAQDFLRQSVEYLRRSGATQVGGPQVAEGRGALQSAIAAAVNSPFGVGGASFRYLRRQAEVDSVYLGCALRDDILRMQGWDPAAVNDEDTDLNARLRRQGGRLLVIPEIRVRYRPRRTWPALAVQYFLYGFARVRTFRTFPETMRGSHLVPPAFFTALAVAVGLVAAGMPWAGPVVAILAVGYVAADLAAAWVAAEGSPARGLLVGITFPVMHLAWTLGLLAGTLRHGVPARAAGTALGRLLGRRRGRAPGESPAAAGRRVP